MTTVKLSINSLQLVHLFENLATALNVPFESQKKDDRFSTSMQKALDDEQQGRITKLVNYKDAVAEILG